MTNVPENMQSDPLKKREEFAISLRKKKKDELIRAKRQRLTQQLSAAAASKPDSKRKELYCDCPKFIFSPSNVLQAVPDQFVAQMRP